MRSVLAGLLLVFLVGCVITQAEKEERFIAQHMDQAMRERWKELDKEFLRYYGEPADWEREDRRWEKEERFIAQHMDQAMRDQWEELDKEILRYYEERADREREIELEIERDREAGVIVSPPPEEAPILVATVVRVIDGDTIVVSHGPGSYTVRYFGIDAPEKGQPCYSEANTRNAELASRLVTLMSDVRLVDSYGRLLRYVFAQDGTFVDAQLIKEGLASAWTKDGIHRDYLMELEREARKNRIGCLWQ